MTHEAFNVRVQEVAPLYEFEQDSEEAGRKAAFHSALAILLDDYDLEDQEIQNEIFLDGAGDGGIDYFYFAEDENPSRILCIQVKHHVSMPKGEQRQALIKMREHVGMLRSNTTGNGLSALNDERRKVIRSNRSAVLDFKLVLTAGARADLVEGDLSPDWREENIEWSVEDLDSLTEILQRQADPPEPEVTVIFDVGKVLDMTPTPRVIHGYVDAMSFAEATIMHKKSADILRRNPRLFLPAKSGFNQGMYDTLSDANESSRFHLYNNGITVVARRIETFESDGELHVTGHDFQIVNGGQTTETLWRWLEDIRSSKSGGQDHPEVYVPLRLVETDDDALGGSISRFNNSQNAITSSDLVANSKIQLAIKSSLEKLAVRPYIYEARRGTWRKQTAAKQQSYRATEWAAAGAIYRWIDLKVFAQVLLSVTGRPEQAKEQINSWFKSIAKHDELFGTVSGGYQAALISDLYLFVKNPKLWAKPEQLADKETRTLISLGRYYICYLIYSYWKAGNAVVPNMWSDSSLISEADSQVLRQTVFEHAAKIARASLQALKSTSANNIEAIDGIRGMLRKVGYRPIIQSWFEGFVDTIE